MLVDMQDVLQETRFLIEEEIGGEGMCQVLHAVDVHEAGWKCICLCPSPITSGICFFSRASHPSVHTAAMHRADAGSCPAFEHG